MNLLLSLFREALTTKAEASRKYHDSPPPTPGQLALGILTMVFIICAGAAL